jgi:hypothetical protein
MAGMLPLPATAQTPSAPSTSPPSPLADGRASAIAEVLGVALVDPDAIAAGEAERRRAERIALGVAEIDPELPAIMDELDAIAAGTLAGYLAEITAPADPDPSPSPSAGAPQGVRVQASALLQTGLLLTWGMASSAAEAFIGGWQPAPGAMTLPERPFTSSGTLETGGRFTAYTTTLTDSISVQDGTVRLAYVFTMHSEVLDSSTNATVASIDDRGSYAVTINPCPREGGIVDTVAVAESDLSIRRPGGATSSARERATATAVTTVTEDAEIGRTVVDVAARRTTAGGASSDVGFTARYGEGDTPSATLTQDDGSEADLQATARGAAAAALGGIDRLVGKAREVWRARCVTVAATPGGMEVVPGSETSITATVRHAVEDREIEVPIRATLEGTDSIVPADEPRDAPAEITYRAGIEPRAEARITFRTTSNRGRAERTETYRTLPRFPLDIEGDIDASLGRGKSTFTVSGRGLKVSFGPGDPPTVRVQGRVRIRGRTSDPTGCRSTYSGSIPVSQEASARLILDGPTARLAVLLTPGDPAATVRLRASCPGGSTTSAFPATMLLGVWALGRDAAIVDLPNGSATIRVARSGPTPKQTWTVTVRPDAGG